MRDDSLREQHEKHEQHRRRILHADPFEINPSHCHARNVMALEKITGQLAVISEQLAELIAAGRADTPLRSGEPLSLESALVTAEKQPSAESESKPTVGDRLKKWLRHAA
jgi:hypothetical protein